MPRVLRPIPNFSALTISNTKHLTSIEIHGDTVIESRFHHSYCMTKPFNLSHDLAQTQGCNSLLRMAPSPHSSPAQFCILAKPQDWLSNLAARALGSRKRKAGDYAHLPPLTTTLSPCALQAAPSLVLRCFGIGDCGRIGASGLCPKFP